MSFISRLFNNARPLSLQGMTDWHCHILPGVDDGVETMEEAVEILNRYEEAGIKDVWLTPHIMEDLPNTTEGLRQRFKELQEAYNGNVTLHLASENMMDNLFKARLESDDLLPIGEKGNTLLVETSYFSAPMRMFETLEAIKAKGYYPLLAHPERYNYIDSFSTYRKLHDMGVKFQVNLLSFSGHYGPVVKDKAIRLLSEGMVNVFGTDLHRVEHFDIVKIFRLKDNLESSINRLLVNS